MRETNLTLFVSYSTKDSRIVTKAVEALRRSDARVWFDMLEVIPGTMIIEKIDQGIQEAQILLLFISKNSVKSSWVNYEWKSFVDNALRSHNQIYLVPVIIGWVKLPSAIAKFRAIRLFDTEDSLKELTDSVKKLAIEYAERKRGFRTILSDQKDRIVNHEVSIITQRSIIRPFQEGPFRFNFHHWQDAKGKIEIIRSEVMEQQTGNVIDHKIDIEQKNQNNLRFICNFNLLSLLPISLTFEIRTTNYYPNLFKTGTGYTDFLIRFPIEQFCYQLIIPNKRKFQKFEIFAHHRGKRKLNFEDIGAERNASFLTKSIRPGDALKFVINNRDYV